MRTLLVLFVLAFNTTWMGLAVILASALRIKRPPFDLYERVPRLWSQMILKVAGTPVRIHGAQNISQTDARVYVCNHVSWFDVFTLASILPRYRFVAKKELFRIPIFGGAIRATAGLEIDRRNRKAAFQAYETAALDVRGGRSVVVYPEGTRGLTYELRPFKKGPFVLAIAAQVPVVPTVIYGTREIQPKGSYRIRPGVIDVTFLEPIPTAGMSYDDRGALVQSVWDRMAAELERRGVHSSGSAIDRGESAA